MSLTIIQRFYQVAKEEADAPALGIYDNNHYHDLPWWFVKSKAKHFGLGLLEENAERGEYFYLFPSKNPTWIYAELGALTVGLKSVPLPAPIPLSQLKSLMTHYPPAFLYLGDQIFSEELHFLQDFKGLKRIVLKNDDPISTTKTKIPFLSFRQIFNSGIRNESKHHRVYRDTRNSLTDSDEMSPIGVKQDGSIVEKAIQFGEVSQLIAQLSHQTGQTKIRRMYSSVDLSHTLGRIVSLYWPIFLGIQAILDHPSLDLIRQLQRTRPQVVYLSPERWKDLEKGVTPLQKPPRQSLAKFIDFFLHYFRIRRIKKTLGGKLKFFLTESKVTENVERLCSRLKIKPLRMKDELFKNSAP